jgi:hypothetical protein
MKEKDDDPTIWEAFKVMFKEEYGRTHEQILEEIAQLTTKNLPTEQYATWFENLITEAKINKANPKLAKVFLMGLRQPMQKEILKNEPIKLYLTTMTIVQQAICNTKLTKHILEKLLKPKKMTIPTKTPRAIKDMKLTKAIIAKLTFLKTHPVTTIAASTQLSPRKNKVLLCHQTCGECRKHGHTTKLCLGKDNQWMPPPCPICGDNTHNSHHCDQHTPWATTVENPHNPEGITRQLNDLMLEEREQLTEELGKNNANDTLAKTAQLWWMNPNNIYISARKSMTLRTFLHSSHKWTEAIALVDSGATENFMNLQYMKWLHLPIKWLPEPRPLFNIDGTKNKSGSLQFYTDLDMQTGTQRCTLWFFLLDLGEHKVILGYP